MNTKIPQVTVVMPVLNGEEYLEEAIISVLNQTFKNIELIIINDGSTDNTHKIIDRYMSYDKRVKCINNPHRLGQSTTRNTAIKQALGKYICIADSDDICDTNRIIEQLKYMETHPNIDILGCAYNIFSDDSKTQNKLISAHTNDIYDASPPVHNPTCLIKTKTFDRYGYYDTNFDNAEDVELWFRWFSQGVKFDNMSKVLYKKRLHNNSISVAKIKSQVFLLLKINLISIFKYKIKFSLNGYLHVLEQLLYLIYLSLNLNKIYAKGNK